MSFSARYVLAVWSVLFSLAVSLSAQTTTTQATKAPRGTVSGRVTIKDKGAPGVAVSLRKTEFSSPYEQYLKATTDPDGFYRITNVAAGSYEIAPSAPAYVFADANNARSKTVVVGEDESVEGINFTLVRGGVVTGKVTDAEGRPVIQQQVNLFRAEVFNQQQTPQRPIFASGNAMTDDRGIYRAYGLQAGRYKVATGRGDDTFMGNINTSRTSYKQVFHPDVTEQTKATIIEVGEGSEANDVDIKLGTTLQTYSVSGLVLDEKGLPAPNIRFGLQRIAGQRPEYVNSTVISDAHGEFFVEGLIPGKYTIFMFQNMSSEMRADSFSFDIVDEDVSGIAMKLVKGASLSGALVLESEDKTVLQRLAQMQIRAAVATKGSNFGFGQSSVSPIAADGSFRIAGLPAGSASFSLGSPAMGPQFVKGFVISRIERDGVSSPRVEIKEGEQVTGLRVVVSFGNGIIRGTVKFENGSLPQGSWFVRLMKPNQGAAGVRPPQVDARGRFVIEGIPAGEYELWVTVPIAGANGPMRPRTEKRPVSVQDGVPTDITIEIDLTPPPKP